MQIFWRISGPQAAGLGVFMLLVGVCVVHVAAPPAAAHGFVGDRFFPATVTTDDPLVTDELALPNFSLFDSPADDDGPTTRQIATGFEFDKLIFPKFALGVSDDFLSQKPRGEKTVNGWDDLTLTAKYEVWRNEEHEAIISVGLETDIGGTGTKRVGADSFSTFTPTIYFGKGFGDLPDSLGALKPFAVTGLIGQTFPTNGREPNTLEWGFALEYSLPYLQQHVKEMGLPKPFREMIPLVEFSFETAENHGPSTTTGTINPGVLWEQKYFQFGVEALIPVNHDSGPHVGVMIQVEIYIDDLFPKLFGHPLFGGQP